MIKKGIYAFLAALTVFAMVTVGCSDGGNTPPITKVTLNPTTLTLEVDGFGEIAATTEPADAVLEWTSDNEEVATVTNNGGVWGLSVGSATITATAEDGGKATCAVTVTQEFSGDIKVEGNTLVHNSAKLLGVNHFGNNLGTDNADGSYTFNGTAGSWSGGGAQYTFPVEKAGDTWSLSDYDLVEMHLIVTDGSVTAGVKKYGGNVDLKPYPDASNSIAFNKNTDGKFTYKTVIGEAGAGIGFQRNTGGPATVGIEKVIFSKGTIRTITFSGGDHTAMPAIDPIKIPDGRTVNFGTSYTMPQRPTWAGHTFVKWYNTTDSKDFDQSAAITKDLTLTAQWTDGEPVAVDMSLNLDTSTWGALPPNAALTGGSPSYTIPAEYATTAYADDKLTITFDGRNRQRAIIPLSTEQISELMNTDKGGVTFRIVGTVERGEQGTLTNAQIAAGDLGFAGFRLHLADPSAASNWNGTTTGKQTPLTGNTTASDNHLVEYRSFDTANKKQATVGYFVIQAMFRDSSNNPDTIKDGFPQVIITVESVTIDLGDTSSIP